MITKDCLSWKLNFLPEKMYKSPEWQKINTQYNISYIRWQGKLYSGSEFTSYDFRPIALRAVIQSDVLV